MFKNIKSNINSRELLFILKYIKEYIFPIVVFSIIGIVSTALGLGGSVVTKYMIDAVTGYDSTRLYAFVIMLFVFGMGSILLSALVSLKSARISTDIYNRIQYDVYKKTLGSKWENIEEYRSGDLMNRLSGDVKTVAESVFGLLSSLVIRLTWFVGSIAIIFYDTTMGVVAILCTPVSVIVSRVLMKKTKKYNLELRNVNSEVMNYHEQTFSNLLTIKSLGIKRHFEDGMKNVQKEYKCAFLKLNSYSIFTTSFMKFAAMMVAYICLVWSVYRLWKGVIVFGTFTLFLQLTSKLTSSLSSLVSLAPQIVSAAAAAGRIIELTELGQEGSDETITNEKHSDKEVGLVIDNISFSYKTGDEVEVIKNFSLDLADNKLVAIVGPSGQGKTTLLKLILGLYNVDSGNISLRFGDESIKVSADTRDYFAYVPQVNTIFAGTVRENLLMVKEDATEDEMCEALKKAGAFEFVDRMPYKLDTVIGENGEGISEGQAQRLAIARAFLKNAPFMLLDEATSALDFDTERKVMNSIVNSGIRIILTTHKNSVKDMCDMVISVEKNGMEC